MTGRFAIPTPTARMGGPANGVRHPDRRPMTAPQREAMRGLARAVQLAATRIADAVDKNDAALAGQACDSIGRLGDAATQAAAAIQKR